MTSRRNSRRHGLALSMALLLCLAGAACGGSSSSTTTPPPPPPSITVSVAPATAALDQGQTLALTATVANDSSNKGVTWTVSGGGALSNQTATAATYTAPATVTSATAVTVTATSVASATATASASLTVNPAPAVTTATLPAATVGTAYSATLAATGGTGALTWAVSSGALPAGLALSATGVLSGTPSAAATAQFSVVATDAAKVASPAAALSLTVNPAAPAALAITTSSLPGATVGVAYSAALAATGGTPPYAWTLASGSSLPAGLSLSTSGTISGTPTATGSSSFTVQVADSEIPPASKSQALSLTVNAASASGPDAAFQGQYAFLVSDPGPLGDVALGASITADGNGHITGGEFDLDGNNLGDPAVAITSGTYTIGSDNRGTLTFTGGAFTFSFAIALGSLNAQGVATQGAMIDTGGIYQMTGSLELQDPTAFSLSSLAGSFAFGLEGATDTFAEAGSFTLAASGSVSAGLFDSNHSGVITAAQAFTGTTGAADANGRGTMSFTAGSATSSYIYYVVSANAVILVAAQTPQTSAQAIIGKAQRQSGGPYTAASLSGNAILSTQSATGVPSAHAGLGILNFDGVSAATGTLDSNDGGTISLQQSFTGLSYAITSAANGRFTLTSSNTHTQVGYMIAPDEGFAVEEGGTTPSLAFLQPQSAGPFTAASIKGTFVLSTQAMFAAPVNPPSGIPPFTTQSGIFTTDGVGATSGTLDEVQPGQTAATPVPSHDTYTVASNGRITTGSGSFVLYIISPTHAIGLLIVPNDPNPTIIDLRQ